MRWTVRENEEVKADTKYDLVADSRFFYSFSVMEALCQLILMNSLLG